MKSVSIYTFSAILSRGVGQVMFQNNALSGILMLIGIFLNSWQMGMLAIGGNILSTLTALFSGGRHDDIENGLYGFNGTLVGIAVGIFMKSSPESWMLLVVASCLSTKIALFFNRQHFLPGFTAPFILSVWVSLAFCNYVAPHILLPSESTTNVAAQYDYFSASCLNIGQVMFQENSWSGLFFLAAILVNSRRIALYTVLGALVSIPIAIWRASIRMP